MYVEIWFLCCWRKFFKCTSQTTQCYVFYDSVSKNWFWAQDLVTTRFLNIQKIVFLPYCSRRRKNSKGSGRPFPGTIWELCDWRIQSKEGVRQEKKSREKRMKSTFLHSFFLLFHSNIYTFFFLNALLKSAMQTRKSSAKELTHFCWWERRVRLTSRQFLGLDYLVPHILGTLMDRVAKFDLWIDTSLWGKHLKSKKI